MVNDRITWTKQWKLERGPIYPENIIAAEVTRVVVEQAADHVGLLGHRSEVVGRFE